MCLVFYDGEWARVGKMMKKGWVGLVMVNVKKKMVVIFRFDEAVVLALSSLVDVVVVVSQWRRW